MADPYGTEEEQLRAIKQWWDRNGSSTLIGIGLAIAVVFGWQWWQQRQQDHAAAAAILYQQMEQAVAMGAGSEAQQATAEHLAATLQAEHAGSRYDQYAQMLLVRLLVESDRLDQAESVLRELLSADTEAEIAQLSRLRLAQVLFTAGRGDEALQILAGGDAGAFAAQYAELRGDVLASRNETDAAREAYQQALASSQQDGSQATGLLMLKIDGMQSPAETATVVSESAAVVQNKDADAEMPAAAEAEPESVEADVTAEASAQ